MLAYLSHDYSHENSIEPKKASSHSSMAATAIIQFTRITRHLPFVSSIPTSFISSTLLKPRHLSFRPKPLHHRPLLSFNPTRKFTVSASTYVGELSYIMSSLLGFLNVGIASFLFVFSVGHFHKHLVFMMVFKFLPFCFYLGSFTNGLSSRSRIDEMV